MTGVAVLFVHGVEVPDSDYAGTAIRRLRAEIARVAGRAGVERVHIQAAYWKPAVEPGERRLLAMEFPGRTGRGLLAALNGMVHQVNLGRTAALLPLSVSGLFRSALGQPDLHWPTMRWAVTNFVGDVIAYQKAEGDRSIYREVHEQIDRALAELAGRAGDDAPLCVIAHSLGSVIASDHFYDLAGAAGADAAGSGPLVRGETLTCFYTLGSPIALWTVRYPRLDKPIRVPDGRIADPNTRAAGEWVNFHDPDDIIAIPLKMLSPEYGRAVREDVRVQVGPPVLGSTPVSHIAYWHDSRVLRRIAQGIAPLLG